MLSISLCVLGARKEWERLEERKGQDEKVTYKL